MIKLSEERICIWFNQADQQRYASLCIGTSIKDKVKALFYDFLDKADIEKSQRDKFLSHAEIEKICQKQIMEITKNANSTKEAD